MARRTKEQKRLDELVERLCQSACNGWSINIMHLHHLSDAGEAAAAAGKSDDEIKAAIEAARNKHATPVVP